MFIVVYALKTHYFYQVDLIFLSNLLPEEEINLKNCFLILASFHVGGRKKAK
jgi:hypothetical protein